MPILLCRLYTDSKRALVVVAIISALVGALTGNPLFIAIDIAVVALGAYFFWPDSSGRRKAINALSKQPPPTIRPHPAAPAPINTSVPATVPMEVASWIDLNPSKNGRGYSLLVTSLVILFVGWVALVYFKGPQAREGRNQTQPAPGIQTTIAASPASPIKQSLLPTTVSPVPNPNKSGPAKRASHLKVAPTVEQCLRIPSDQKMRLCLENAK